MQIYSDPLESGISCEDGCDFSMGEYCRVCGEGLTWEQLPTYPADAQEVATDGVHAVIR